MPDFLIPDGNGGWRAQGAVAEQFAAGLSVNSLRTNTVLQKEEWLLLDTAVIKVATERLGAVADLISRGLSLRLPNGLGTTVFQWEDMSDMTAAEVNMDGVTGGEQDRLTFDLNSIPLPIIHKDFWLSRRVLEASRNGGSPLDTSTAEVAGRLVAEQIESILFNGSSGLTFGGGTLRGYLDHPDRNTIVDEPDWDGADTGELILTDVIAMIDAAHADNMFGPYMLYIPPTYFTALLEDFKAASDKTILQRILEIPSIMDVRTVDQMATNQVLLVQLTSDVVKEIIGLEPTVVQWETHGGMRVHFKVMAIMVPRIASDHDGRSGIVDHSL